MMNDRSTAAMSAPVPPLYQHTLNLIERDLIGDAVVHVCRPRRRVSGHLLAIAS
jgi:hypothetical protein